MAGTRFVELVAFDGAGNQRNTALLVTKSGMKQFVKNDPATYADLADFPNIGPWTRVTLAASGGGLVVRYDDATAAGPIAFPFTSTEVELRVGLASSVAQGRTSTDCDVTYDSIVVRFAP